MIDIALYNYNGKRATRQIGPCLCPNGCLSAIPETTGKGTGSAIRYLASGGLNLPYQEMSVLIKDSDILYFVELPAASLRDAVRKRMM